MPTSFPSQVWQTPEPKLHDQDTAQPPGGLVSSGARSAILLRTPGRSRAQSKVHARWPATAVCDSVFCWIILIFVAFEGLPLLPAEHSFVGERACGGTFHWVESQGADLFGW